MPFTRYMSILLGPEEKTISSTGTASIKDEITISTNGTVLIDLENSVDSYGKASIKESVDLSVTAKAYIPYHVLEFSINDTLIKGFDLSLSTDFISTSEEVSKVHSNNNSLVISIGSTNYKYISSNPLPLRGDNIKYRWTWTETGDYGYIVYKNDNPTPENQSNAF